MNLGFGCSGSLSTKAATTIAKLMKSGSYVWLGLDGFYSEFQTPMKRTFEALGCPNIFALREASSPHAPAPRDAKDVIVAVAQALIDDGAKEAAVIFAAEFDEDPRYTFGSPADLDRLIDVGWPDTRMRFDERGGRWPYYVQEYNEVPLVFKLTPPSA